MAAGAIAGKFEKMKPWERRFAEDIDGTTIDGSDGFLIPVKIVRTKPSRGLFKATVLR